jgi:hypothetical protein
MHWNFNMRAGFLAAVLAAIALVLGPTLRAAEPNREIKLLRALGKEASARRAAALRLKTLAKGASPQAPSSGLSRSAAAQGNGRKKKASTRKTTYTSRTFEQARALAEKRDMPLAVTWSGGGGESMFFKNGRYGPKFVWVHLNTTKDAATLKKLGKDAYFAYGKGRDNGDANNHQASGYIFMNADGVIYSRLPKVSDRGIDRMLVAVCRRHYGYKDFHGTSTFDGRPDPRAMPGKIKILPTPKKIHVWKDCSECKHFIEKAMPYIRSKYPGNWYGGMLGSWTSVPAMMMYGKDDALLKQQFEGRAEHYIKNAPTTFSGYMNWFLAGNGLSMSEYALRYGLTPKLQGMMEKTHQDAAEYIDDCLSWFHHPRKGGKNYSWEIGFIGCMYHAGFAEMDYMGVVVEPGLSLARAASSRGSYGSVGGPSKNGVIVSGMYPAGRADDPFTQHWAQYQWGGREQVQGHNPKGGIYPQQQHAYANWNWMGAAVGIHRMGPAHYDNWATEWIHALIKLQLEDGSVPQLVNDTSAGTKDPMDYVKVVMEKNGTDDGGARKKTGNWEATGVIASIVLMSEPGAFYGVPIKPKGSLPNQDAYRKAETYFKQKQYADAHTYYSVVLPPGKALHLVPSARVKMRVCEEKLCLDPGKRREMALAIARYPAETRADAGVQLYRKLGKQSLVISSINGKKLSAEALLAYGLIQKGNYGEGLSKIKECEAEASEYDKKSFRTIEAYVLADVKIRLERIAVVKSSGDVYQLFNAVAAADKDCKGVEYYEKELSEIRTHLALPQSLNLKVLGEEYSKLIDSSTTLKLLTYLTNLEEFAERNSKNAYGVLARDEVTQYRDDIKKAVAEVNKLLEIGDAYSAKAKMAKCEKMYRMYSLFEELAVSPREALKSKENLERIKLGGTYERLLNDKSSSSKPGAYITRLNAFIAKSADTYYGGLASDLNKGMLAGIDSHVTRIAALNASGDVYLADRQLNKLYKAYGTNKTYVQKTAELKELFKTRENRKLISTGKMYYRILQMKPGRDKDRTIVAFKKKYGDTYYGKLLKK